MLIDGTFCRPSARRFHRPLASNGRIAVCYGERPERISLGSQSAAVTFSVMLIVSVPLSLPTPQPLIALTLFGAVAFWLRIMLHVPALDI